MRQRFRARRVALARRLAADAVPGSGTWGAHAPNLNAGETHGVGEIARRHRTFAGALQLAHREHAFAAGHAQAVSADA